MNINPISKFIKKDPKDFTKADIVRYIEEKESENGSTSFCWGRWLFEKN